MDEEEICVLLENDDLIGAFYSFERAKEKMDQMIKDLINNGWKTEDDYDEQDMEVTLSYENYDGSTTFRDIKMFQTILYY